MSKKWGRPSPRRSTAGAAGASHASSSLSVVTNEQLAKKVEAVSKACHVIMLETVQLR